ncbi:hypothetical protein RGQ29_006665 [Quercus rubra]|uniref:DNA-directed RNA polymerase n=1 Tax=Quercus rubra TaxID=3512 RepID=A0AAN7E7T1_QUERU|nr:hypothetical protein RGQ29_006665 [Quercus rubra]
MSTPEQVSRIYKVRKTVFQMLRDRGYSVDDSEINMTRQQFTQHFGERIKRDELFIHKVKEQDSSDQIYVFFPEGQVGAGVVKNLAQRLKADNIFSAIVVAQNRLTAQAKHGVEEVNKLIRMEVFEEKELVVNITEHVLVPKHVVLTNDEKKEMLKKYGLKDLQLPQILVRDPVAKYYGLRRGQVVKIIRESMTADEYETYRLAV